MDAINYIIPILLFIWGISVIFGNKMRYSFQIGNGNVVVYSREMHFLYIIFISAFFFGSNALMLGRCVVFFIVVCFFMYSYGYSLLLRDNIFYSFVLFYTWLTISMFWSEGIIEGFLMLVKYLIPFVFFLFAFYALNNKNDYIVWLQRINRFNIVYIFIHGIAPIGRVEDSLFGYGMFGGEHGYSMAILLGCPITLYALTKDKKYLWHILLYSLPAVTYIRRAAFGAFFIGISIFLMYRYRIKGILCILILALSSFMAIVAIEPLRERFFGGDKGDATLLSISDIQHGEFHLNSSGRDVMWAIVLDKFFVGNELQGSGLGTMKKYITSDENEHKSSFMILHNDYLHLLCEVGIVGVSLWVIFIIVVVASTYKVMRGKGDSLLRYSAFNAMVGVCATGFIMYFANVVSSPFLFIQPFVLIGFFLKMKILY